MMTKALFLTTSMIAFAAISEPARAGATISDTRYWPSEARPSTPTVVGHSLEAFGSMTPQKSIVERIRYRGGPKSSN
jgi:hypothetical protein